MKIMLKNLFLMTLITVLCACGQKGALYLPDEEKNEQAKQREKQQERHGTQIYEDAWPW